MNTSNASKILVVFYSRSGTTREVALAVAQRCGADVEELREVRSRRGLFGFLRSAREAMRGVAAEIVPPTKDARVYDLVLIGTPVWAGHVASPMRGYLSHLEARGLRAKRVAFFCTMGGRGAEEVFLELAQLTHASPRSTLALTTREVKSHRYSDRIDSFVGALAKPAGEAQYAELQLAGAH